MFVRNEEPTLLYHCQSVVYIKVTLGVVHSVGLGSCVSPTRISYKVVDIQSLSRV